MRSFPFRAAFLSALLTGCGGDESPACGAGAACPAPGGGGAAGSAGGVAGGAGTGSGGVSTNGGASGAGGSASDACGTIAGTPTGRGACYVSCLYDGSLPPTYDRNGDCTKFGSKCGLYNYCMPNITCTADINCGAGRACGVGGQCLIACATDAECPTPPSGAPLLCKPVDTGTLVCRPYP